MAGVTGLETAAFAVTGGRSNQLSYTPAKECIFCSKGEWWAMTGSNRRPSRCKRDALPTELIAPIPNRKGVLPCFGCVCNQVFRQKKKRPENPGAPRSYRILGNLGSFALAAL